MDDKSLPTQKDTFVIRIWWEAGLTRPDGRPLWHGRVQHVPSNHSLAFQCLDELNRFIQVHAGGLEEGRPAGQPEEPRTAPP
jgi:hypothetical protein